jgi:hypothetical protein
MLEDELEKLANAKPEMYDWVRIRGRGQEGHLLDLPGFMKQIDRPPELGGSNSWLRMVRGI